jgi:hypothetical protein
MVRLINILSDTRAKKRCACGADHVPVRRVRQSSSLSCNNMHDLGLGALFGARSVHCRALSLPFLGCTARDTFGKSDCATSQCNRRPYILNLLDSQPQSAPAPESRKVPIDRPDHLFARTYRSIYSFYSFGTVATSRRTAGCRNEISQRLSRKSLSGSPIRAIGQRRRRVPLVSPLEKSTTPLVGVAILTRVVVSGARAVLHSCQTARDLSTSYVLYVKYRYMFLY